MLDLADWQTLWHTLGGRPATSLRDELLARYREPHRSYHTTQHLSECLAHFRLLRDEAEFPAEIEIALWFHDAIYDTRGNDNEKRSADWARDALLASGVAQAKAERVHALVMATEHRAEPSSNDAQILVDVDLAILGAPRERFEEYERQVRDEYRWVPDSRYASERRKVLEHFATRPRIFHTTEFYRRFEAAARHNIAGSLGRQAP